MEEAKRRENVCGCYILQQTTLHHHQRAHTCTERERVIRDLLKLFCTKSKVHSELSSTHCLKCLTECPKLKKIKLCIKCIYTYIQACYSLFCYKTILLGWKGTFFSLYLLYNISIYSPTSHHISSIQSCGACISMCYNRASPYFNAFASLFCNLNNTVRELVQTKLNI